MTLFLQDGNTPLIAALVAGHVECVKLLLAKGAQANHQEKVGSVQGWIQGFWKGVVVVLGNPPHQLGGMGEHSKLTIGVCGGMVYVYIEG